MIVTCPDCDTSFQLDESRIPQKGIRVRCSRCKHAFHLAHPSVSRSEAIDAIAEEAVRSGGANAPSVTQDLVDPGAESATAAASAREEINNENEAEWEFNQDIPSETESSSDHGDLFGSVERDKPSGLDLDLGSAASTGAGQGTGPAPAAPRAPAAAPFADVGAQAQLDAAALDIDADLGIASASDTGPEVDPNADGASAFGSVDDFSSLMDDDPLDTIATPEVDDPATDLRAQAKEQASTYAQEGRTDDLGDPNDWDFFDGETQAPPPRKAAAPVGRIGVRSSSTPTDALARDWGVVAAADPTRKGRVAMFVESAGRIVGWTFVVVAFSAGLITGLWTTAESFVAGERVTPIGPLEAVDMRAQWVDTARAGRLLVVSGGLRNASQASATLSGPLEIALLDRLGNPLDRPPVSAGVTLQERQLRELPESVLASLRAQAVHELQGAVVPAGGLLPFQALVFDAPSSRLRFEARLAEGGEISLPEPAPARERVAAADDDEAFDFDVSDPVAEGDASLPAADPGTEQAPGEAVAPTVQPSGSGAPGYDNPYGEDAGVGLQDL